jgi:hypothetical protein
VHTLDLRRLELMTTLVLPLEVRDKVTGKDVANMLDTIFFYGSYVVMVITTFGYILITPNTIIPLTAMITIITIRSAHIGFEEAGIDDDTSELVYFSPHSDWKLLEYSTESEDMGDGTLFSLNIRIKRRALYYGVMVIAPTTIYNLSVSNDNCIEFSCSSNWFHLIDTVCQNYKWPPHI